MLHPVRPTYQTLHGSVDDDRPVTSTVEGDDLAFVAPPRALVAVLERLLARRSR